MIIPECIDAQLDSLLISCPLLCGPRRSAVQRYEHGCLHIRLCLPRASRDSILLLSGERDDEFTLLLVLLPDRMGRIIHCHLVNVDVRRKDNGARVHGARSAERECALFLAIEHKTLKGTADSNATSLQALLAVNNGYIWGYYRGSK